jgi:glutathione S-transferase
LDLFLSKTRYVAGDELTIADFSVITSLTFAEVMDYSLKNYKNITSWQDRLKSELSYYHECHDQGNKEFREWLNSLIEKPLL